jgi:hypothetical protein
VKLYLSRTHDGKYTLTAFRPLRCPVRGTGWEDLYPRPGDPVDVRGLCPWGVGKLFGVELAVLETKRVELNGKVIA